jgi:RNA polymerase sigma-70 factor (ECF subfamily)
MTDTTAPAVAADAPLVEAASNGDLQAWERLVRRYQEPVFRVAYLIARDTDLAEAATRSTFVRAYRALPSYDPDLGVMPWLMRITAGESRQQRRESGRPTPSSRPIERSNGPHFPSTTIPGLSAAAQMTPAERETVALSFDRLGEEDRLLIASRYLFGLSRSDAANALAIASGQVDSHLTDALKRLRDRMAAA